jgi:hypothetical protein
MKKILLSTLFLLFAIVAVKAQSALFERYILQNGTNDTIELSTGQLVIIGTSSDDAEQENDAMDALNDDDLDIGWEGDPEKLFVVSAGLRFQNMTIPRGALIDSAFLRFCSHEGKTAEDVAKITIHGEASDNAVTYDLNNLITDRPRTSASLLWTVDEEWGIWEFYRTPNIGSIVQEIVNRSGWNYGNSMAFILTGENQGPSDLENAREIESFENIADPEDGGDGKNHPERVPQILVYYRTPTGVAEMVSSAPSFVLSPNPTRDSKVILSLHESSSNTVMNIYNQQGQQVYSKKGIIDGESFDLAALAKGLYIVTLNIDGKVASQKLIVE